MTFVSRDEYLCLQGAREAYSEAKMAYNAFGREDNLEMVEDDSKHWMTPKIRLAIYAFFMKHFNIPGDPAEVEAEILSQEELKVTPTGQISTSFGGDMIFDVNKKETEKLMENLEKSRKDIEKHLSEVKSQSKRNFRIYCSCRRNGKTIYKWKVSERRIFCWKIRNYGRGRLCNSNTPVCSK